MSSTNRGAIRPEHDYYITQQRDIIDFLHAFTGTHTAFAALMRRPGVRVLDPCAGGNTKPVRWLYREGKNGKPDVVFDIPVTEMPYPAAIRSKFGDVAIDTVDIRDDSPAEQHANFLKLFPANRPDVVIFNPPFSLATEFIKHALDVVKPGGFVIALLRLNFFGTAERKQFFDDGYLPGYAYVHHHRLGFTPDGNTDSIEYMHAVWWEGTSPESTALRVI